MIDDVVLVDQLRQAAAAAAPAIRRLLQAGMANGAPAATMHKRLGTTNPVLMWCDTQLHILRTGDAQQQALADQLVAQATGEACDGDHKPASESCDDCWRAASQADGDRARGVRVPPRAR